MSEEIKHFSCALSTVLGCVTSSLEHTEDPGTGNVMQFLRGKSFSKLLLVQAPYLLCFFSIPVHLGYPFALGQICEIPISSRGTFPSTAPALGPGRLCRSQRRQQRSPGHDTGAQAVANEHGIWTTRCHVHVAILSLKLGD